MYAQDPSEVLVGDIPRPECIQNLPLVDLNRFEIGHVVRQLEKGNINFIVGVMSPRVIVTSLWHKGLKRVFRDNPSKALCNSIIGLAEGHLKKYGDCVDDDLRRKKLAHAIRVCEYGIRYLREDGKFPENGFEPVPLENGTVSRLMEAITMLKQARALSDLPDAPEHQPFGDYLFTVRRDIERMYFGGEVTC